MTTDGLIDPKPLKEFLIAYKTQALERERLAIGPAKDTMSALVRAYEAFLLFLSSQMREEDMDKMKFRLDSAPVPTSEVRARTPEDDALREFLIENAKKVPIGTSWRIADVKNELADKVASKMWALRSAGQLPEHIAPLFKTDKQTKEKHVYISHKTPEELEAMRRRSTKRSARR